MSIANLSNGVFPPLSDSFTTCFFVLLSVFSDFCFDLHKSIEIELILGITFSCSGFDVPRSLENLLRKEANELSFPAPALMARSISVLSSIVV